MAHRYTIERTQTVTGPLGEVFELFSRPENLADITPPWLAFRIVGPENLEMRQGLEIEYRISPLGVRQKWVSRIARYDPPHSFVDEQIHGPYRRWWHLHELEALGGARTRIHDRVDYELPFGWLGRAVHRVWVRRQLEAIFRHRHRVIAERFGDAD